MPELPDVTVYVERLGALTRDATVERLRLRSPFVLRTVSPPAETFAGARVVDWRRIGKRIALTVDTAAGRPGVVVIHLMIAGRLRWRARRTRGGRDTLVCFDLTLADGAQVTLELTEASKQRRASLHLYDDPDVLDALDRGGLDLRRAPLEPLAEAFRVERHTLKRTLTDPRIVDGVGNAYSDEILHAARLSPFVMSDTLDEAALARLQRAAVEVLGRATDAIRAEVGDGFPERVTAFRDDMAVHGRYRKPCPVCGDPVQRIVYAQSEANYCATCQTGGRLLADRALSRLLKKDWPRTLEALEQHLAERRSPGDG